MALVVKDRVRETTTSTGTTAITLNGAVSGFQSFSVIGDGNTTYYTIVDAGTGAWEVGIGTYSSTGTQLTRDTVLESSSGGALVNFGTGTKDVFVTYPAERSVYTDAAGAVITPATASILGVPSGGTGANTLTGYVKGNGTAAMTASSTIPNTDISGLGTMSTQDATNVNIDGGTIDGTAIGGTTAAAGKFTTLEATGVSTFAAGTVSAPSITTTADTNTGIFFPAADTIAFAEGGVEAMRITSSGNVGIGTSSPEAKLDVVGTVRSLRTTQTAVVQAENTGGVIVISRDSSTGSNFGSAYSANLYCDGAYPLLIWTNNTERMRIDSSGNVGIGTSSPGNRLHISTSSTDIARFQGSSKSLFIAHDSGGAAIASQANFGGSWVYLGDTNSTIQFAVGGTERMRIDPSGNVQLQKNISVGGATPTTSGTGITFPATQSASSDANTLDDYEEGTWTPQGSGVALTVNSATYTKIGRLVNVSIDVTWPSTANTGPANILSLPFTVNGTGAGGLSVGYNTGTTGIWWSSSGSTEIASFSVTNANMSTKRLIANLVYHTNT